MKLEANRPRTLFSMFLLCLSLCLPLPVHGETKPFDPPAVPDEAFGVGAVENDDPRVEARLISDINTVPAGDSFRVGVLFDIDPDWHIYWRNSGEAGLSTELETEESEAIEYGALHWPAPHAYVDKSGEVATLGYANQTLLFFEAELSPGWIHPTVDVTLTADFLACKVDCIPGSVELQRTLRVGPRERSTQAEIFEHFAAEEPLTPDAEGLRAEFSVNRSQVHRSDSIEGRWLFGCEEDGCSSIEVETEVDRYAFMPDANQTVDWKTLDTESTAATAMVSLKGEVSPDTVKPCEIRGVVYLSIDGEKARPFLISSNFDCVDEKRSEPPSAPDTPAITQPAPADPAPELPLWQVLLLALLGGMLLNLMPCVFPVLAIKVFSFVKLAHEERGSVYAHSAAYTAGIVGSMLALAAVVIGLKSAGQQVGWGFQFQEPIFISLLAALLVAFALNLFGVFEVTAGAGAANAIGGKRDGLSRSLGEGVLAVILATPCSAPFMGTAIGFAFASSDATIVAVFVTLGIGLALPFVVLTAIPAWAKLLPKPGEWMVAFKQLLGFALVGTVVWLVWILGQAQGNDAVARLLAFLTSVGLAVWIWGRVQFGSTTAKFIGGALALSLVIANGFYWLQFPDEEATATVNSGSPDEMWQPWSEEAVAEARAAGKTVFVDFTADWCITCKVNERGPLARPAVVERLTSDEVVAMKADWTRRDETIRAVLARHGKAGVPLYLVYPPEGEVQVLPELLSPQIVLDALDLANSP